jgi:hypothetical protein
MSIMFDVYDSVRHMLGIFELSSSMGRSARGSLERYDHDLSVYDLVWSYIIPFGLSGRIKELSNLYQHTQQS